MTDVMRKAVTANGIKQGATFAPYGAAKGTGASLFETIPYAPLISGVSGAARNNYLDHRFDDIGYYG